MNPQIELIIKARNEAKQALNNLNKQIKDLETQLGRTDTGARRFSSSLDRLRPVLLDLNRAGSLMTRGLLGLGRNLVQAAANFETYENTVRVFSSSQAEANETIANLIEFSKELVGLDTGNIIKFYGRIKELGLTSEDTIAAIRGITEGIAEQGKPASEARRSLEQFTQALGNVKPLATDFKTVFREVPQIVKAIELAFGQTARSAQEFRDVLENVGLTWQEARPQLIQALDAVTTGANIDTLNAQLDILQDQAEVTAAAFGKILVPAVVAVIKQITEWLKALEDLDEGTKTTILQVGAVTLAFSALAAVVPVLVFGLKAAIAIFLALVKELRVLGFVAKLATAAFGPLILQATGVVTVFALAIKRFRDTAKASDDVERSVRDLGKTFSRVSDIKDYNDAIEEQVKELNKAKEAVLSYQRGVEGVGPGGRPLISTDAVPQVVRDGLRDINQQVDLLQSRLITAPTEAGQLSQIESELTRLTQNYRILTEAGLEPTSDKVVEIANQIQALTRIQKTYNETTETTTTSVRNLVLELVKADTELRRARNAIRVDDAQTVDVIQQQTDAQIAAIQKVANLEVEQANQDIEDELERAAKIQEIRDKEADDIAEASRRGQDRIKKYEDAVFKARLQSGAAFVAAKKAQIKAISDANIRALVLDANARAVGVKADEEAAKRREAIAKGAARLSVQANVDATRVNQEATKRHIELFKNEEHQRIASTVFAIDQTSNLWQARLNVDQRLREWETAQEQVELERRTQLYTRYFANLNRLSVENADQFIASAIRVTASVIRQVLIQEAVKAAASGNIPGAIGLGIAALGTSGVESFLAGALDDQARLSASTRFHEAANDARVTAGTTRALINRASAPIGGQISANNNQQDSHIEAAAEQGILNAPTVGGRPIVIENNLIAQFPDGTLQKLNVRENTLIQQRRAHGRV